MASALIGGLLKVGTPAKDIKVIEPEPEARDRLEARFGVQTWGSPGGFLQECDLTVWAVKPQVFKEAALAAAQFCSHHLHLSVAAGIPTPSISKWLGINRIARAMPNTPALVGLGQTGLFATQEVSSKDKARIEDILSPTGQFLWVENEVLLDAVTALSGSGPAYVYLMAEAMIDAGVTAGLSRDVSRQLVVGTLLGSARMLEETGEDPVDLRAAVTSPGGTTAAAIRTLEVKAVRSAYIEAVAAAVERSRQLGR